MEVDERLEVLERELQAIKERNARVEADKAWETSWARAGTIGGITYFVAAGVLWVIGTERVWLGAVVPVVGFLLSVQSLPVVKRWWIETRYRRKGDG